MEPFELTARESIRDLVARYNASGDSGRFDAMLALFAEDATLELEGGVQRGKPAIRALFEGVAQRTGGGVGQSARFIRHFTATHQIDVLSESEARGRCYLPCSPSAGSITGGATWTNTGASTAAGCSSGRKISVDAAVPGGWASQTLPPQEAP